MDLNGHGRILELKRFYQKVKSTQHLEVEVIVVEGVLTDSSMAVD